MIVLVTGGTRGIGRGIAQAFRDAGHTVVVCGRRAPDQDVEFVACDVRDPDQVAALIEGITTKHGGLDCVVNNAGGSPPAEASTASPRFSEAIIRLNLLAPLHVAQAANAWMQANGGGSVINVCSVSGMRPSPGTAAYGAAKAGLLNLTRSLAQEWAPAVRVNAVTPGIIETEAAADHYPDMPGVISTIPLGRMGTPRDVASACVFLSSDEASWVSGANLVVDGGGERPPFLGAQKS
ncbi:MAG: SDR family oxidoreductase [Proteobacteria bacterium]|nr:SDR family oxidoreductase [Pseudomonadota bacterium]MCP4922117.1 SDR family oxidoreductase [Pseudomonadota bacterium]